jgi:taurine dioxygenase
MALSVTPMDAALGAEISGIDLTRPLGRADRAALRQAMFDHVVLVARGQTLTSEQLIAFGGAVGELGSHVLGQYRHPDHPEIMVLSNTVENGRRVGLADAGSYWHSDISYKARPSDATVLYALEVPETGGDTQFIDMTAVYDDLPADLRGRLDGLEAIHDYAYRSDRLAAETGVRDALTEAQRRETPSVTHPVVRTHPETGREALYINPGFTVGFVGLDPADSDALLADLFARAIQPRYIHTHKWRVGDVLVWDNRCSMHLATGGYGADQRRVIHRLIITGAKPYHGRSNRGDET